MQRQERVGADQAGRRRRSGERKEVQRQGQAATQAGRDHRQGEIEVVDREADGVGIGRLVAETAVAVTVGEIGAADAGKGLDVLAGDDQGIGAQRQVHAQAVEADFVDAALLESEAAFQRDDAGHGDRGVAHRGLDTGAVEVQPHRVVAGGDFQRAAVQLREIQCEQRVARLVDAHPHVGQIEVDDLAEAIEADVRGVGRQCGVARAQGLVAEQCQAEAEVVDHQADGIGVGHVVGGGDAAVAVGIIPVRPADADEGLHMRRADGEAFGQHRHVQAAHGLGRQGAQSAFLEGEGAADMHEIGDVQRGIVQAGADGLAGEVEQHRVAAGGQRVARGGREAVDEVQRRAGAGGVELEVDAARRQRELAGVEPVQRHRVGMRLGGGVADAVAALDLHQAEIDALGAEAVQGVGLVGKAAAAVESGTGVAHEDIDVGTADGEAAAVGHRQRAGTQQAEVGLLEADGALRHQELRDLQRGLAGEHADAAALEVQRDRVTAGADVTFAAAGEVELAPDDAGAVVVDVQVAHRQLEVVGIETVHPHLVGVGRQCGVAGAGVVAQAQQAEVQPIDAEAVQAVGLLGQGLAAIDAVFGIADEGGDVGAADRETARAEHRRGQVAGTHRVAIVGLLEADRAADVDELRDRQRGPLGIDAEALAAAEVDHGGSGRTQRQAAVERRGEVDRAAVGRRPVQFEAEALGGQLEVAGVEAVQPRVVHADLGRHVALAIGAHHQQAEVQAFDPEAVQAAGLRRQCGAAVETAVGIADERGDVLAGDGQHRLRSHAPVVAEHQRRGRRGFLETDATGEVREIADLQPDIGLGAQQFAGGAIHVQRQGAAGAGGDLQRLKCEIDHPVIDARRLVDLQQQVLRRRQQVAQADKADAAGLGTERSPLARRLGDRADQREAEVDVVELQAHGIDRAAVDAGKHIDAAAADGQHTCRDLLRRRGAAGCQSHLTRGLLDRQVAAELHEAEEVDLQEAAGAQGLAERAVDVQVQAAAGACEHTQIGRAVAVIDDGGGRAAGLVHRHLDAAGLDDHAFGQADHAHAGGCGLQRCPGARRCCRVGVRRFARQRQTELQAGELQAHFVGRAAAHTGEGVQAGAADAQHLDVDLFARRCTASGRQRHRRAALLDGQVAAELHEAEEVDLQEAAGAQGLAERAVDVQVQAAAGACEHTQIGRAVAVIDDGGGRAAGLVHRHLDAAGLDDHAFGQADHAHAGGCGLQRCPGARRCCRVGVRRFARQRQTELQAGELQAHFVGRAAAHTGEGVQAGAADAQHLDVDLFARRCTASGRQRHRGGRLAHRQVTGQFDKPADRQRQAATGLEVVAVAAGHVHGDAARAAGGHRQHRGACGVVDHRVAGRGGAVEPHQQVVARQRHPRDAAQVCFVGTGQHTGPLAAGRVARAHQGHAKLHASQLQRRAVDNARTGRQAGTAQREQVHQQAGTRFVNRRACGVGRQLDRGAAAHESQVTLHPQEVAGHDQRVVQRHLTAAGLQRAEGVAAARHVDGVAAGIGAAGVPAHRHQTGRHRQVVAQRRIERAAGFQQRAATARPGHQGHPGPRHAGVVVTCLQQHTGRAGQHLQIAAVCILLEREVTAQAEPVTERHAQADDGHHRRCRRCALRKAVAEVTDRESARGLGSTGGIEPQRHVGGTGVGEAAATEEQRADGFQRKTRTAGRQQQAETAVVQAQGHIACRQTRLQAAAGHQQTVGRRHQAQCARQADAGRQVEGGAAGHGHPFDAVGAVEAPGLARRGPFAQ